MPGDGDLRTDIIGFIRQFREGIEGKHILYIDFICDAVVNQAHRHSPRLDLPWTQRRNRTHLIQGRRVGVRFHPQLDRDVGITPFDLSRDYEWPTARWTDAGRLLSDHRPIWIAIRTDQRDDD